MTPAEPDPPTRPRSSASEVIETYLAEQQIPFRRVENTWAFALSGEHKHSIPVVLVLRERTLSVESFFIRAPMDNAAEVYRLLLARNARSSPVRFAADADGDVLIVGEAILEMFDSGMLDALLGAVHANADEMFDAALTIGFATYLARDLAWREKAGIPQHEAPKG